MILFDHNKHRYYDTKGDYISATTLLKRYIEPFDAKTVAKQVAEKRGGKPEDWEKRWKQYGEERANYGSEFHERKEEIDGNRMTRFGSKLVSTNNQWLLLQRLNKWNYLKDLPDGHYTELMLWHEGYRVAGTSDRVLIETISGKRYMHIEDHKTNTKLPQESWKDPRTGRHKMMRRPVSHIMDCKFWHYKLQLSIYQFMAEYLGFHVGERRILHYPVSDWEILNDKLPSVEDLLQREPVVHSCLYYKKEVVSMCEDYFRTLKHAS